MTCRAGKWFFSRVDSFVSLEITTLAECLVTFGTSIWLFSNVGPFMGLHVIIALKFLVTFWTGIRFLNCVGPLVCLQLWALAKPLFTFSANKWFLVWALSRFFKCSLLLIPWPHFEQVYGFSPKWILSCIFEESVSKNADSHLMQAIVFWSVCIISCLFRIYSCFKCNKAFTEKYWLQNMIFQWTMWQVCHYTWTDMKGSIQERSHLPVGCN